MSTTNHHAERRGTKHRTPITRALRRIADAVEDVVDDVIERGETAERDGRRLVQNLFAEKEEKERRSSRHAADETAAEAED